MQVQTTPLGSELYGQLARFESKEFRANMWNSLLIDDQNGKITNNVSGSLKYDDHKRMLEDVVAARKFAPTVFESLVSSPGVAVSSSLSDTLLGYSNMNEFKAKTSMNASNRQQNETSYKYNWVPQPIYHCDFKIPWRQGSFAYKQGDGSTEASMQVALERDRVLVLGDDSIVVNVNGVDAQLYGLVNHPRTLALPAGIADWSLAANTDDIVGEAIGLVGQLYTTQRVMTPNSVMMYVANDVWTNLESDYSTQKGDRTVLERIKAITAVKDVMPSQWLPAGSVLLVEASPMSIRIARASDITVAPWQRTNQMEDLKFTVFAASALQVREDTNQRTGILYATR